MRCKTIIITVLSCFSCLSIRAHVSDTLHIEPVSFIETFHNLDKSLVSTGILEDYGTKSIDFSLFDGRLSCSSRANIYDVYNVLLGINASTVNTNNAPPNAIGMISSMSSYLEVTNHVPIGIAAYKYTRIREDAVSTGRLQVAINEILEVYDVYDPNNNNSWVDPYTEDYVVAFSPYLNIVGRSVTFDFSTSFQYTNLSIDSMQFNPGDGNGFQTVTNPSIPVYYTSSGYKTLELRIKLTDNTWLYAFSNICVTNEYDCSVSPSYASFTSHVASSDGTYPSAEVDVLFSNGTATGFSKQPIIVAELFDPFSDPSGLLFHRKDTIVRAGRGARDIRSFVRDIEDGNHSFFDDYDLVYINWNNSTASIESNADILKQVVEWVNTLKCPATRSILIGQSMGGIIARHALCDMEANSINHEVGVYVSVDSPHLGASIPLGYLYLAQLAFNEVLNTIVKPLVDISKSILSSQFLVYYDELMALQDAISVRQMVKCFVKDNYEIENTAFSSLQTSLHNMGFPSGDSTGRTLCIALSNGGDNVFVLNNQPHLEYSSIRTLGESLYYLIYSLTGYSVDGSSGWWSGNVPIKNVKERIIRVFQNRRVGGNVFESYVKYKKDYSWGYSDSTITNYSSYTVPPYMTYNDSDNGSFYEFDVPDSLVGELFSFGSPDYFSFANRLEIQNKIMFVPMVSSLCFKKGDQEPSDLDCGINFYTTGVNMDLIPFDGYRIYADTAAFHASINYSDLDWVCSIQNLSIVDTVYSDGSRQYFLNDSGYSPTWSTSSPTIATINNSGQLTINGYGDVDIYATIGSSQNKLRLKKTLSIPLPSSSGFPTYSLTARDMTLDGVFDHDDFLVRAIPSAQIDSTISPYVRYCWGRKVGNSNTITWTESNSTNKMITMGISEDHVAYFKVRYLNNYSPIYSVLCHPRPRIVIIDPLGYLYTEDMGGESFIQVKSSGEQWVVNCMGASLIFDHDPSLSDICTEMLAYPAFKNKVKQVCPWGENERVVIPYLCEKTSSGEVINDVIVFVFREFGYEE